MLTIYYLLKINYLLIIHQFLLYIYSGLLSNQTLKIPFTASYHSLFCKVLFSTDRTTGAIAEVGPIFIESNIACSFSNGGHYNKSITTISANTAGNSIQITLNRISGSSQELWIKNANSFGIRTMRLTIISSGYNNIIIDSNNYTIN